MPKPIHHAGNRNNPAPCPADHEPIETAQDARDFALKTAGWLACLFKFMPQFGQLA